ncbi:probable transcription regulatory protein [Candidatus Pelagibacter sp. HTCC7211]|nr:probable transcription regulatory protein [Candidatus Pelagibacter sp. HTCC7211]
MGFMKSIPSISSQIDEKIIFKTIAKNFSKLAPYYYTFISNWLIRSYKSYQDIDKFIIVIYLINKDLIFFRRNGLIIDYDTFYKEKTIEIEKINITDISKDLKIPKESVRRKVLELEKKNVIKKTGKKIFVNRSAFYSAQAINTLKDLTILLHEFSKLLKKIKVGEKVIEPNEISISIKKNFSFCWYQFYKFLFIFTNRWRNEVRDLETFSIGILVMLNASHNDSFRIKDLNLRAYQKFIQGSDERGMNAMSIAEITGIPRPTVVRKLKFLINNRFLHINEKKLISVNIQGLALSRSRKLQDQNMLSLSNFIFRVFNQIKVINVN